MSEISKGAPGRSTLSLHKLGVFCGLAAAVWLGSAEAPTKLVNAGFSPFIISMGMVMGAFVARWTRPHAAEGNRLSLRRPARQASPDCVGAAGGNAVGRGQHAHHLRGAQRGSRHRLSAVEYQQPGGPVLGLAALQGAARLRLQGMVESSGRRTGHCRRRGHSRGRHRQPVRYARARP